MKNIVQLMVLIETVLRAGMDIHKASEEAGVPFDIFEFLNKYAPNVNWNTVRDELSKRQHWDEREVL